MIDFRSLANHVRLLNYYSLDQTPSPGHYPIWNTFDGPNPAIKLNALTTSFKQQSSRDAYGKVYVAGSRSPRGYEDMPGPGHYIFRNNSIGLDAVKFTLKPKFVSIHDPVEQARKQSIPGPGAYKSIGIDAEGKY